MNRRSFIKTTIITSVLPLAAALGKGDNLRRVNIMRPKNTTGELEYMVRPYRPIKDVLKGDIITVCSSPDDTFNNCRFTAITDAELRKDGQWGLTVLPLA